MVLRYTFCFDPLRDHHTKHEVGSPYNHEDLNIRTTFSQLGVLDKLSPNFADSWKPDNVDVQIIISFSFSIFNFFYYVLGFDFSSRRLLIFSG